MSVILSYIQTQPLLEARKRGQVVVETSRDLGINNTIVMLSPEGVSFVTGERLDWASVEKINQDTVKCYTISMKFMHAIQTFSKVTNRLCSLMPSSVAPRLLINGFVVH